MLCTENSCVCQVQTFFVVACRRVLFLVAVDKEETPCVYHASLGLPESIDDTPFQSHFSPTFRTVPLYKHISI